MKRIICVLFALIMLSGTAVFALPAAAGTGGELLDISHPVTALANPLAIVREVTGYDGYKTSLFSCLSQILVNGGEISDFGELFRACRDAVTIPVVRVTDESQIDALLAASGANSFYDISVISSSPELLALVRSKATYIRTGLEVAVPGGEMTSKEADAVRRAVRGAPATFCIIGSEFATAQNVRALQSLAVAVWVNIGDGGTAEILKAIASGCNGMIGVDDGAIAAAANEYCEPGTFSRTPLFIGHRGYEIKAPENTLDAFEEALKNGGEIFEIDVDITKDGKIVVIHDGSINRTTNYDGDLSIGQMTLEEIREYSIVSDVYAPGKYRIGEVTDLKVPTLEEVLELLGAYPGHRVFIELKGSNPATVDEVARIVKEYGMEDQVDVISFNASMLSKTLFEGNIPGMATGYLGGASGNVSETETALAEFFSVLKTVQGINSTINYTGTAKSAFSTVANDRGMTVWPWTFHRFTNDAAFFSGTSGITTSDVGWAKDMYLSISAGDIEIGVGKKADPGVIAVTYSGENITVAPKAVKAKTVDGDCVSFANGRIIGEKEGTATVVFSVGAQTAAGSEYYLISAPITVTVTKDGPGTERDEPDDDGPETAPERVGKDILISHLNNYSWYANEGMIVVDTGEIKNVKDLPNVGSNVPRGYVMYAVEKRAGVYIATDYVTGAGVNEYPAPDPEDGFLLFFAPSNHSYKDAKDGKLLGWEFEPCGFDLYYPFAFDTRDNPSDYVILKAYRTALSFIDVKSGEYYEEPVAWAVKKGITEGTGEKTFSPSTPCTRAQVVTFLWRAAGAPKPASGKSPFSDVKTGDWYAEAVMWAVENGITVGTSNDRFSPDDTCTRAQIVTFLWRAEGKPAPKSQSVRFSDVKNGEWYAEAVFWAIEKGITVGTSETAFSPDSTCTRAQVVTFLYRDIMN